MDGPAQVKDAIEPELVARGGGLPAVVGLHPGTPDDHVRFLPQRLTHQEFVVASAVAAEEQPGAVIPFDEQPRHLQTLRKTRDFLKRRRQMSERHARQTGGLLAELVSAKDWKGHRGFLAKISLEVRIGLKPRHWTIPIPRMR